jgi:muramoyltetrapeptide carboxypeptidase
LIRAPALESGDLVRVVAPSGPFDPERLERGLAVLRDRFGLRTRMRDDICAQRGYLAGDDARREAEWREAVGDPEARAIWCARGGYGAIRILAGLEPGALLRSPKLVIGFSDVTAIHAALNQAGLVTVHGPVLVQVGRLAPAALDHLEAMLFPTHVRSALPSAADPAPGTGCIGEAVIRPGRVTGPLLGGSLTLLSHLCGTRWQPRFAGAILFFEDVGEKPYKLDRYLTQLRLSGALDGVAGVVVGRLTDCDEPGQSGGAALAVRAEVASLGVPAIEGIAAGHEVDNRALPLGAQATLVAPAPGEPGLPRLLFDEGATA